MSIYNTKHWEQKRAFILRRDKYQCQLSARYGKRRQADTVHHIFPLRDFPEYAFESWNLISLSKEVHNTLHDRETDELTDEGIRLLERTALKYGVTIPPGYVKKRRTKG